MWNTGRRSDASGRRAVESFDGRFFCSVEPLACCGHVSVASRLDFSGATVRS